MHVIKFALSLCLLALLASPAIAQEKASPADIRQLRSHTMEAKSQADRMVYYVNEWKSLGSQVGDSRVQKFNQTAEKFAAAFQKGSQLASTLPGTDEGVTKLVDQLNASLEVYNKAIKDATAMLEGAKKAVEDVGGFEAIQNDMQRLSAIAGQFAAFEPILQQDPGRAARLFGELGPANEEVASFEKKYADFLKQQNADTNRIRRELKSARGQLDKVQQVAAKYADSAVTLAKQQLDEAQKIIELGLSQRKPAFFGADGGVTQQVGMAEDRVKLATAINPTAAMPLVERLGVVKAQARQAGEALKAEIIAANKPPADRYQGSDASALKEQAKAAWLAEHPDDEIVLVTIPTGNWKRETKWTWWNDAFYFTDRSDLQAAVVFRAEGENGEQELHWYPVDITKDHQTGDTLKFSPWATEPLDKLTVRRRMRAGAVPGVS